MKIVICFVQSNKTDTFVRRISKKMERKEFCDKLLELRKASDVRFIDICFAMKSTERSVYRIEKAEHSFSMNNALSYLAAINIQMALKKGKGSFLLNEQEDIFRWLKKNREKNFSQRSLAEKVGCVDSTITKIETGRANVGIDIFLQLADVLGFSIELSPKKLNEQLHTNKK